MKFLILLTISLTTPALAQYEAAAAPESSVGGLPPFLAKMKRHDVTLKVERRGANGTVGPAEAGLPVGIRILANGSRVKEYPGLTDARGTTVFQGVPSNPEVQGAITYEIYVIADNVRFPFNLAGVPSDQAEIFVAVPEVTTALDGLALEHGFIELFPDEETLVGRHEIRLTNPGQRVINLGALPGGGLVLPCPEGAKHPSLHDEHDPMLEVRGTDIVFKGALLPGQTARFTVVYQIPYDSKTFEWIQPMPVPATLGVAVVSLDRQPGHRQAFPLNIEERDGQGKAERSELDGGRRFSLLRGTQPIPAGQPLRFAVTGLPEPPSWKAWSLMAAVAGIIAVVLLGFRARPGNGPILSRAHLITERDRLVRALARMRRARDKGKLSDVRFEREREAITARLVSLYRALDRTEGR